MNSGRRTTDFWSMDKKMTIGGIVAVLSLAGSILTVYVNNEKKISALEIAITYQRGVNDQMRDSQKEMKAETAGAISEVKQGMTRVEGKVDRLIEALMQRK